MPAFGPCTLKLGTTGSQFDLSCHVNSCKISPSKESADSTTKLCGTVRPGPITYTYTLNGNIDLDSNDKDGFLALSQAQPGSQVPFTFTPDNRDETTATGKVIIDSLEFGGDEYGVDLASDFEFDIVGTPTYTYPDTPKPGDAPGRPARFQPVVINGRGAAPTPIPPVVDGADQVAADTTGAAEPSPGSSRTSKRSV